MIKKFPALLAVAASLALAIGPVSAAPNSNGAGSIVAGKGWRIAPDGTPRVEFKVGAQIAPGRASGTYDYASVSGGTLTGTITCGSVDTGAAVIGGHITDGNILVGGDFLVFLVDDGAPTFGSIGPDSVSFTLVAENGEWSPGDLLGDDFPLDFPAHCPQARGQTFQNQESQGLLTVLGNIAVH